MTRRMRRWSLTIVMAALLAGCSSSQIPAAPKAWCDANLALVGAAGTKLGSAFHFGGRPDVTWDGFLGSSPVEQGIIVSEATDGAGTWDAACRQAYMDANPGASPLPTPVPSGG